VELARSESFKLHGRAIEFGCHERDGIELRARQSVLNIHGGAESVGLALVHHNSHLHLLLLQLGLRGGTWSLVARAQSEIIGERDFVLPLELVSHGTLALGVLTSAPAASVRSIVEGREYRSAVESGAALLAAHIASPARLNVDLVGADGVVLRSLPVPGTSGDLGVSVAE
jgi:hypothetical protein